MPEIVETVVLHKAQYEHKIHMILYLLGRLELIIEWKAGDGYDSRMQGLVHEIVKEVKSLSSNG